MDYLSAKHWIGAESKNINSMNSGINEALVRVLNEKTCNNNLKYLTMIKWKECFNSRNMFRKNQAWCPICYEESLQLKQPIYEQLIWNFNDIEICRKHQVRLMQKCPYCNNEFSTFSLTARVGYCNNCNSWLGLKTSSQIHLQNEDWDNWVYDNIGQLLAINPTLKEVTNLKFEENTSNIICFNKLSIRSLAKELNVSHRTVRRWISGSKPILYHVLSLSFKLGYPVYDIFFKDINIINSEILNIRIVMKKKKKRRKIDMDELKKALDEAIIYSNGMSIKKLSEHLGIHHSTIKKNFPIEAEKIKTNYYKYLEECKAKKLILIENTMKLLFKKGIFPSRKALTRELGKRIVNNSDDVKVWIETLEELGCSSEDCNSVYRSGK